MIKTKIGVISDLHLSNDTANIKKAFSKLYDIDWLLLVGDIVDRPDAEQYDIFLSLVDEEFHDIPKYCVFGNHDNAKRDDTYYRQFEKKLNDEYLSFVDECGAFYKRINEHIDLIGLNPVYYQKKFTFPDNGAQIDFLQKQLDASLCKYHIVMCHPPLIAHNPQRTPDMESYIDAEQDTRLQKIIDENERVIFLSGHLHFSPGVEVDEARGHLYINDGSVCTTAPKSGKGKIQPGNITQLDIAENEISVIMKEIHTETVLVDSRYNF